MTILISGALALAEKEMVILDFHPVDILIFMINIAILSVLLRAILWKPVSKALEERAERVRRELSDAENTRAEADALKREYAQNMENIEAKGRDFMRESQIKATEDAELIIKDARAEADRLLRESRERIAEERERAVMSARKEITQLAADMASRILKREVSPDDNISAAQDFFSETR